ncbi:protein Z-dependent protease inhibitor [Discoglossus pictus]
MYRMKRGLCLLVLVGLSVSSFAIKGGKTSRKEKHDQWHRKNQTSHNVELHSLPLNISEEQPAAELSVYDIAKTTSDFGFKLYRKIADKHDDNIFFSPFSLFYGLASLIFGTEGSTHKQLLKGLNLNKFENHKNPYLLPTLLKTFRKNISENEHFILDLGSVSFAHEIFPIKEGFVNLSTEYFDMEFQNIDFHNSSAKNIINSFVNKKSKGKIPQLYDEIDPQTKLLLLDFIFFKGKWDYPFNPAFTQDDSFFINKYKSVKVPMMFKKDKIYSVVDKTFSCTIFKLNYKGSAQMLIVMPDKEGDFGPLEDHLSNELIEDWLSKMQSEKMEVLFPKFSLDQKYKMRKFLQDVGIRDIFGGKANLTRLTDERNIQLTDVTQRAVIDIDEKGTEASAATGSEIVGYSLPPTIKVDHPFIFMIYDDIFKALLFIGRVVDPTKP